MKTVLSVLVLFACQINATTAWAGTVYPVSQHMKDIQSAVAKADVVVIYPTAFFMANLTEGELHRLGCR